MSLRNFYVVSKAGKIYFSKNFQGEELDQSLVVGFMSSISNFCKTLLGEDIREVISQRGKIFYREYGEFVFVAHTDLNAGTTVIQSILRDLGGMCEFLFGSREYWDLDSFDLKGVEDIINMYFTKTSQDPSMVVGGVNQIYLDSEVKTRLDKLLAYLESQEGVCGNSTMLVLGESSLYSRFGLKETRTILQYCRARPMGTSSVRFTPVFLGGSWQNLYLIRVQNYILVTMAFVTTPFTKLEPKINNFKMTFIQSRLEIPSEEPPVLLRLFAKRETLAMLYHNIKSGNTVFPQLRPGPEVQQKEILGTFWNFFSEASASLKVPGVTEFSISKDQYRFYARSEGIHKLYLLLAQESVSAETILPISSEILKNLKSMET